MPSHTPLRDARRVLVVDLGFGDAGKGTVTDYLARRSGTRPASVVRFNGGAQAGHNVVLTDGRHHTFAQFGAGTFVPGVRTFLSHHVVLHPTALLVEAESLAAAGVSDAMARLHVSERCLLTTPVHQAATCVRELARGGGRHGSCGVGVGETMRDALAEPGEALRARDLHDEARLVAKVLRQQEAKRAELSAELRGLPDCELARQQLAVLAEPAVARAWAARAARLASLGVVRDDEELRTLLSGDDLVIFEGAQGVLLDEWVGFHPHTTWSTCTWANAEELFAELRSPHEAFRLGVLRTFGTRHGAGPFPTESPEVPRGRSREHNVDGPWQGAFRTGWLDALLARYALAAAGQADGLAVTHMDRVAPSQPWPVAIEYDVGPSPDGALFVIGPSGRARDLRVGPPRDLAHTEALGRALFRARPTYRVLPPQGSADGVLRFVEELLGARVVLTSSGPTAREKTLRG